MLLIHPRIYLGAHGRHTDAIFVEHGKIKAIGTHARELRQNEPVVEPECACIFPALAEAHIHMWGLGIRAGTADLSGLQPQEIYGALRLTSPTMQDGWVLGRQFDDNLWPEGMMLSRDELDALFPSTPVCLRRVDGHALLVNSEALRRAGISEGFTPRAGGHAERDANGRMTGKLIDNAMQPILDVIPPTTEDEDEETYVQTANQLLQYGVTSAHKAWLSWDRLAMLQRLHIANKLPIRTYAMLDGEHPDLEEHLNHTAPFHDPYAWLSYRAVKFFADGALGSKGAHLLYPYADGTSGLQLHENEFLQRIVQQLMQAGWQIAIHAIGDAAARQVLDAYASVPAAQRALLRPRLEHAQIMQSEDIQRLRKLSTIASIQPIHLRSDTVWAKQIMQHEHLARLFPWRELVSNCVLASGSDFPIDDPNPWHGVATALNRHSAREIAFNPEQALTCEEVLAAYTTGAAYAAHWEQQLGQLMPGFAADFIALDRDPFHESAKSIWDTQVLLTWLDGELVFEY